MPDWSYRTVFQPLLFRLPFETARGLALGSMGRLAWLPGGRTIIDLMGHMAPDPRLQTRVSGRILSSPVMLGHSVDPDLVALSALGRFGFGLMEVGPIGVRPDGHRDGTLIDEAARALISPEENSSLDVEFVLARLRSADLPRQSTIARLGESETEQIAEALDHYRRLMSSLAPMVGSFALPLSLVADPGGVTRLVGPLTETANGSDCLLLVVAEIDRGETAAIAMAEAAIHAGADGVIIDVARQTANGDLSREPSCGDVALRLTPALRAKFGNEVPLIVGGGIHEPLDAVRLINAGATMVQVDSGLVFTGPGLPKRINDALLCWRQSTGRIPQTGEPGGTAAHESSRPGRQAWLWTFLMGTAMLIGGIMAMVIATTRVVMPYDEQFVGMTRSELAAINDNLLAFMTHDRVTLAGTMLALGTLYTVLSWCGIRRGWHWAHVAVIASAFVGFFTFFTFLGFGYFDPLHAFVTVVLFQFLLLGVHSERSRPAYDDVPNLTNHTVWKRSLWGQLLFVVHGAVLIVAGAVICSYGMTSVFVPEDLEFMQTTAEALCAANPQLVPLVAHDRATFGGMLIACGVTVLLCALWGFRQGNAWLWWALFTGGVVAYLATIFVHWHVGYTDLKHLLPAYGGLAILLTGSSLSRPFLCRTHEGDAGSWRGCIGQQR